MAGFQFKQFVIQHELCAMKVGTDSIMLGSWVEVKDAQTILDIGTGSGLLAIMLAQKTNQKCKITGIDIDQGAVKQAKQNVSACPWSDLIDIELIALEAYNPGQKVDLIISNPPYFSINHSANKKTVDASQHSRIAARQTASLDHVSLLKKVASLLSEHGRFYCVLPAETSPIFIQCAKELGLYCQHQLNVRANDESKVNRCLFEFAVTPNTPLINSLTIYQSSQTYSEQYRDLCRDYYLNF